MAASLFSGSRGGKAGTGVAVEGTGVRDGTGAESVAPGSVGTIGVGVDSAGSAPRWVIMR